MPEITILKRHREDLPLAQNKFLKKTAKGKVLQCGSLPHPHLGFAHTVVAVLRERYVRDDIPCGFAGCALCAEFPGFRPVLPERGYARHSKFNGKNGHWLVIDTNVVLHQVGLPQHREGLY